MMMLILAVVCALCTLALTSALLPRASSRSNTCVVSSKYKSSGGKANDAPAFEAALKKCATDSNIILNATDYNILTPISATKLSNVGIRVQGNLHMPRDRAVVQKIVNDTTAATNGSSLY